MANTSDPFEANRLWSPMLSPGLSTGMPMLDIAASMFAQQGVFPQPQGNNSVMDMMMLRSRNMDQHYIMKRALASSQMAQRLGGINMDSPAYQMMYPFLAMPDSPAWKMMSPLIGGNPVRAQMGLYADLNGQTLAQTGRFGSVSAGETDRMMDQLQGLFYEPANFGRYVNSVTPQLRQTLGDTGFETLNKNWSMGTLRGMEREGFTGVNRDVGNIVDRTLTRVQKVRDNKDLTDSERSDAITDIKKQGRDAAQSFIATISNRDAQLKMSESFAKAIDSSDTKEAIKAFKGKWSADVSDAYRVVERGAEMRSGQVPGGIDYRFTRGFNIEDITGAFGQATRTGLAGRGNGLNVAGFASSAVGALDAARGVFGKDLSGKELTEEINKLVGTGYVNMSDEGDARKLEELLRNVKAMARVAGVSIESMKGVIDEAKGLAAQNPNLPMGISGLTATGIATTAMSNTTAALSYMDPRTVRMLGGPVGMTSAQVAGAVQGQSEDVSQHLGALYFRATQVGGKDSSAAKAIMEYAQSGDTTRVGQNAFFKQIATQLDMTPYQAMSFAMNNPLASTAGLQLAPELGRAGQTARMRSVFNEMDMGSFGSNFGVARTALTMAKSAKFLNMTDSQISAELKRQFPKLDPSIIDQKILPLVRRGRSKRANGEGSIGLAEAGGIIGFNDINHNLQKFVGLGGDMLADQEIPELARSYKQVAELRRQSAKMEGFYASRLAEVNAPILQRFFQSGIEGTLAEGGIDEVKRILGGGPDAVAYRDMVSNLADAQKLYGELPEGKMNAAGEIVGGASDAQMLKVLSKLNPDVDFKGLMKAGGVAGVGKLRNIGRLYMDAGQIGKDLSADSFKTYADVESYLGHKTGISAAIEQATLLHGKSGDISSSEKERIAEAIMKATETNQLGPMIKGIDSKAGSASDIKAAALGLVNFDPTGQFDGNFDLKTLTRYGIDATKFASFNNDAVSKRTALLDEINGLTGDDDNKKTKLLKKLYGNVDFADVGRYTEKINIDTINSVADAATTSESTRIAKAALSGAGMSESEADRLVRTAKGIREIDSEHMLTGSKKISVSDLTKPAMAQRTNKVKELALEPFHRMAGEGLWNELMGRTGETGGLPASMAGKLATLRKDVLGGRGDIGLLAEKMKDPNIAVQVDRIMGEGESGSTSGRAQTTLNDYLTRFEQEKRELTPESASKPGGLGGLDMSGVISAIKSLVDAVTSASKF